MEEIHEEKFCKNCNQETLHLITETTMEIEYRCEKCNHNEKVVKTFF